MNTYVKQFDEISIVDIAAPGGKKLFSNEMFTKLSSKGVLVPNGFAITHCIYGSMI